MCGFLVAVLPNLCPWGCKSFNGRLKRRFRARLAIPGGSCLLAGSSGVSTPQTNGGHAPSAEATPPVPALQRAGLRPRLLPPPGCSRHVQPRVAPVLASSGSVRVQRPFKKINKFGSVPRVCLPSRRTPRRSGSPDTYTKSNTGQLQASAEPHHAGLEPTDPQEEVGSTGTGKVCV